MTDAGVEDAYALLRSSTTGDLRFDEHLRPIRYVVDSSGRLAAPVMVAMLGALETVLFVPEYGEGGLELLVSLEEFDEHASAGAAADRWRIYHGSPEDVRWAFFDVDTARVGAFVLDGDALMRPNPLAEGEAAVCREINRNRTEDLRRACRRFGAAEAEAPVLVGVDPLGFDVRRRFDVIRIPAPEPMPVIDDARRVFEKMCGEES